MLLELEEEHMRQRVLGTRAGGRVDRSSDGDAGRDFVGGNRKLPCPAAEREGAAQSRARSRRPWRGAAAGAPRTAPRRWTASTWAPAPARTRCRPASPAPLHASPPWPASSDQWTGDAWPLPVEHTVIRRSAAWQGARPYQEEAGAGTGCAHGGHHRGATCLERSHRLEHEPAAVRRRAQRRL